jgi:hypothetical protein
MARVLRKLIDPRSAPLRTLPRSLHDLMVEAHNNTRLLIYDNVSTLSDALSDALYRIATGRGYSTRLLFTDREHALFNVQRPVTITAIEDIVRRSDLIDRCIFSQLLAITDAARRMEEALWDEFEADYPRFLGALLSTVLLGLRFWDQVTVPGLPRMADFTHWGEAVCRGLG